MKQVKAKLTEFQQWLVNKKLEQATAKRLGISVAEVKKRNAAEKKTLTEIRKEIAKYKSNGK